MPYFCYLFALRPSDSKGVAMRMVRPNVVRVSGQIAFDATIELIAPERSEYRDDGQIRHFWHCAIRILFEVIPSVHTKSIEDIYEKDERISCDDAAALARCGWSRWECSLPYFLNLSAICERTERSGSQMSTIPPKRLLRFGMNCAHCDNELIAPEWTEFGMSGMSIMCGVVGNATFVSRPSSTRK